MPARLSASGSSSAAGAVAARARSSALRRTITSGSGTPLSWPCRRSSAYRNSSPCHGLSGAGAGWTRSSTSAKRNPCDAVSYFSSDRSVYRRTTASATPRLTGLGIARPYREVQYASASPGSSARCSTEPTSCRAPGVPATNSARAASSAPTSDAERMFASDRSQRRNRPVQLRSVPATAWTSWA